MEKTSDSKLTLRHGRTLFGVNLSNRWDLLSDEVSELSESTRRMRD